MTDIHSIPPVYDPDMVRTIDEYMAQATLMGYIFDWRDGTFCMNNNGLARCWSVDSDDKPNVPVPEGCFAFALDCVTGEAIDALTAGDRRTHFATFGNGLKGHMYTQADNYKNLPWIRYPER